MADRFTEYVSLGMNCEGAFQIRRVLGTLPANFFNWAVTPLSSLESLLRTRFAGLLEEDKLSPVGLSDLVHDASHDYQFHTPFDRVDFRKDPEYEQKLRLHRARFSHQTKAFMQPRDPSANVCFFYKNYGPEDPRDVRRRARRVRNILQRMHPGAAFTLVVLQLEALREDPWDEEQVANRYLRRFAPLPDTTDAHVSSWDAVFREFPHVQPLRLAGY